MLGITSTQSTGAGFITVQPCGGQAEVSNLNFVRGVDITNLTVVPLPDDGRICVTASERTHVVVDVFGGFGVPGLARELEVGPYEVFPAFSADQHDYIAYCPGDTANHMSVHVRGMPRTTVTMGGSAERSCSTPRSTIDANDAIVHHDHADRRRCPRGVLDPVRPAGLPAHHDHRRRRRPTRLVRPRQQRRADSTGSSG